MNNAITNRDPGPPLDDDRSDPDDDDVIDRKMTDNTETDGDMPSLELDDEVHPKGG